MNFGIIGLRANVKKSINDGSPLVGNLTFIFTNGDLSPPLGSYTEDPPTKEYKISTHSPIRKISISVFRQH
jgi:hypothetical protein